MRQGYVKGNIARAHPIDGKKFTMITVVERMSII